MLCSPPFSPLKLCWFVVVGCCFWIVFGWFVVLTCGVGCSRVFVLLGYALNPLPFSSWNTWVVGLGAWIGDLWVLFLGWEWFVVVGLLRLELFS